MTENIKIGTLNNGLKYLLNKNKCLKSSSIFIFVRVGSKHENKVEEGLAHFLEHMLFKGTKSYPSNLELNKKIDDLAATTNAGTSKNFTNYFMKLPTQNLIEGIKLLSEMVFFSLLKSTELVKEREVVCEEINKIFDDSESFIEDLLPYYLFKGSKLEHFIMGDKKLIREIPRRDILKFYKKYYIPSNSCLVISGNFNNKLEKELPKIFNFNFNEKKINHIYELCCYPNEMKIITKYREHFQITIGIAFPIFNYYDKKKYFLDILISHLDGNLTSKLWMELREKNPLVYDADASYELFEEGGIFQIKYSLEKKNVFKSLEIIKKIVEEFRKNKITQEEFNRFKKSVIFNTKIEGEDSSEVCNFYGEQLILDEEIKNYNQIVSEYEKCNLEDINTLAKNIFDFNKMIIIQLGDINKDTFQKKTAKIFS